MNIALHELDALARSLIRRPQTTRIMKSLHAGIESTAEPFVWDTLDLAHESRWCPAAIQSAWIFLLRKRTPSGAHYHPNSIQHMITLSGTGRFVIGDREGTLVSFFEKGQPVDRRWLVIDTGTPHEFFPADEHLAVLSLHTSPAEELEEITLGSGRKRIYLQDPARRD